MMKRFASHISAVRWAVRAAAVLTAALLCVQASLPQSLANYNAPNGGITRTTGAVYNSIEFTGYSVPSWRYTGTGGEDDNRSYPIPIGFDFWYVGARFTTFSISTNGFIDFSTATNDGGPSTNQYGSTDNDISSSASNRTMPLTIAPFYYDQTTDSTYGSLGLIALAYGIKYQTSGTAGNRVLTVEWIRTQPWYTGTNGKPSFNYQVKLYERTGVIEFAYGTMNIGSFSFSAQSIDVVKGYTCGMSGTSVSATPTAAQLLLQQTQNTTTFSYANASGGATDAPHMLNIIPASNSKITFTPPVPSGAPSNAGFTGVSQTAMTVNWTDNASNEVGYVIYRSDDGGSTYNFITQLAANTTSYTQTGLLAGTTYYWRIYAVSEGALSAPLNCSQSTTMPGAFISVQSGLWNTGSTWQGGTVPTNAADVTIADGTTVQVDGPVTVNSITVGSGTSGTLLIGSSTTAQTVNVIGLIDVKAGGTFSANPLYAATHILNTTGNIQNAGTFDLAPNSTSRVQAFFNKAGQQTITGSGAVTRMHTITLNMGSSPSNILDVFATQFTSPTAGFLTINNGTFNLATGGPVGTTYTVFSGNVRIPATGALRINHPNANVATVGGSVTVAGEIRVNGGSLQIGNAADNNLIVDGGHVNLSASSSDQISIAGRLEPANAYALTDLTIAGGSLIVGRIGSTSTTNAPFTMNVPGSRFVMSGGSIIVQQNGGGASGTLGYENRNYLDYAVTGGTIQIGGSVSLGSAKTLDVYTTIPMYNFVVNNSYATARLINTNVDVLNDVSIAAGGLNVNALNMTIGGSWTRNGSAVFTPTGGKITFLGSGAQTVNNAESFNKLSIAKGAGSLMLTGNVAVADSFALSQGTLNIQSTALTLNGAVTGGGSLVCAPAGTVSYAQAAAGQNVLAADYGTLTFSAYAKVLPQSTIGILTAFTPAGTGHTITNNTIDFKSSSSQSVPQFTYNNLSLSAGGVKTIITGAATVNGTLTVASGVTLNNAAYNVIVAGAGVVHNGAQSGTGAIVMQGAVQQTIGGSGAFNNLTINNAQGVAAASNLTVNGALGLTAGVLNAGTNTVSALGTVARTSGYVSGKLARPVPGTGNPVVVFDIGDATYSPATITFTSATAPGTVTVSTTAGDHPQLGDASSTFDPSDNVNRYWTISNASTAFSSYSAVFTFSASDLDIPNTYGTFVGGLWNGSAWSYPTTSARTSTSTTLTGMTSFGDFVIGNGISSGMYQTQQSGNWNALTTWLRYNGTAWVQPTAGNGVPSSASSTITINNGHTVTVTANATIDGTVIENGGQVTVNSGVTLTIANGGGTDLTVNGTIQNNGTISFNTGATMSVGDGGRYVHAMANANRVAVPTAAWDDNSTCEIRGSSSGTTNTAFTNSLAQQFGNFIWNYTGQQGAINLAGMLTNIHGSLSVQSTNGNQLILYGTQTAATTIGGSLNVSGGTLICKNNSGNAIINVSGNLSVTSGTLQLGSAAGIVTLNVAGSASIVGGSLDLAASTAVDTLDVAGDYAHTGGTVLESGSASGTILFSGSALQTFTSGGTVQNTVNYIVMAGATLKLPAATIVSGNSFTLRDGANLEIQSADGITTPGTAAGNVRTTSRVFGTAANYTYSGTGAQVTGTALPAAVNKLIIKNSGGTVTQTSASTTVSSELSLVSGVYNVGSNTLILNDLVTKVGGSLASGATGTVNYNKQAAGQAVLPLNYGNLTFSSFSKVLPASDVVRIAGVFTPGAAASHTVAGSTIEFTGTNQSVPSFPYNNLIVSGTTPSASNSFDVAGLLTINSNLTLNGTTVIVSAQGGLVNNGSASGSGKISLNSGSAAHQVSGSGQYAILELNDPLGASATSNITIANQLSLTSGILSVDAAHSVILTGSAVVARTNGYVNGKLQKPIAANAAPVVYSFEIGDASAYTPATITFVSVSAPGTLTASTTPGKHPYEKYSGLDGAKNVNRYWTLTGGGGLAFSKFDVKFDFVNADVDAGANPNAFFAKRFNTMWYAANTVTRNSNWILSQNYTAFGDFLVGELSTVIYWTDAIHDHLWSTPDNWSSNSLPTASNDVMLDGTDPATINVDIATATCRNLTLLDSSLTLTILPSQVLTITGDFSMSAGVFSTQAAFPAVTGTTTITGGTFGYDAPGGTQTVAAVGTYKALRISGGGTKTAAGDFAVDSTLSVTGGTFDLGTYAITAKEHVINTAAVTGAGRILLANAPSRITTHTISGNGSFSNLELNDAKGAVLAGNTTVGTLLTMTQGTMTTGANTLTITGTRSGPGIIIGTITRTHAFALGTSYAFEGPFTTIAFDSAQVIPSSVTVKVVRDSSGIVNTAMNPINRYYDIGMAGGSGYGCKLRLHYEDAELGSANSETSPSLKMWRDSAGTWIRMGSSSSSTTDNWVQWDLVRQGGKYTLSSRRVTDVMLTMGASTSSPAPGEQVTYSVTYNNRGDGAASNFFVVLPVPAHTAYVPGTIRINGVPKADSTSGITVSPGSISINLSVLGFAIAGGETGTIAYTVTVN